MIMSRDSSRHSRGQDHENFERTRDEQRRYNSSTLNPTRTQVCRDLRHGDALFSFILGGASYLERPGIFIERRRAHVEVVKHYLATFRRTAVKVMHNTIGRTKEKKQVQRIETHK